MEHNKLPHDHNHMSNEIDLMTRMPNENEIIEVSNAMKQLGDPSRLRIFWLLCHCEECVLNIASLVDMSSPAVSHHLKLLKSGNLISSRRDGKEMYYKAAGNEIARALHHTIEHLAKITCPEEEETLHNSSDPERVKIVKEIHSVMTQNLATRYTIEELAKEYLMNASTLKDTFKAVYGMPIAAYMKQYRMNEAITLLRETNDSMAEIAAAVGYESQSKFTAAFKNVVGVLPTTFRKNSI